MKKYQVVLDDRLHERLRAWCFKAGVTMQSAIEEGVRMVVRSKVEKPAPAPSDYEGGEWVEGGVFKKGGEDE